MSWMSWNNPGGDTTLNGKAVALHHCAFSISNFTRLRDINIYEEACLAVFKWYVYLELKGQLS